MLPGCSFELRVCIPASTCTQESFIETHEVRLCVKFLCTLQNKLARVVIDRVPCLEMVRFVNSGTEACLSVLRLMRAFTGRNKVCEPSHTA